MHFLQVYFVHKLNRIKEQTTLVLSYQLLLTYNPLDIVSAEGFNDGFLIATLIRNRNPLLPFFVRQQVLTEFRQLKRFNRLLKWPVDQPLLANTNLFM